MPRNHLMPLMKCAGNYGVRRESFILHESCGGRQRRPLRGDACRSRAVVTLKHVLRISNDAGRRRELFSVAPNRGRGGDRALDYALGRRM